jgi:hypothetical protein
MNNKKTIISKIKELFKEEKMAADYTAVTGEIIRCLGEELAVGEKVVQITQGEENLLPDGSYFLDNGKSIVVEAGEVKEITDVQPKETEIYAEKDEEKEEDKVEKMESVVETKLTDGTEVRVIVAGDQIAIGDKVEVKDAEGNFVNAPEGRHQTIEGLIIYVDADGLINEIETVETEKETEENEEDDKEELKSLFDALNTFKKMFDELSNEHKELKESFNKFSKEPSAESITKKTQSFSKTSSKEAKLKFFSK